MTKYQAYHHAMREMGHVSAMEMDEQGVFAVTIRFASTMLYTDLSQVALREYTGLHDKNGKEIYDGDIVKIEEENTSGSRPGVYPVTWGYFNDCCVEGETWILGEFWQPTLWANHEECEIIGNIYEHPELMRTTGEV